MIEDKNFDFDYMSIALSLTTDALNMQEVPVGALLVSENQIIGKGWNQVISHKDPTAHAEILAIRQGAALLKNYRIINSTLYVTLEPCLMCIGAMIHARIQRLVFGAYDPKTGAVGSKINVIQLPWLNHRIDVTGGLLADPCGKVLTEFFRKRRK